MATDDLTSASLTAKERLQRIEEMLNRMDQKMDSRFDSLSARISAIEVSGSRQAQDAENGLVAVESRLRALETNVAPMASTVAEKVAVLSVQHEKMQETIDEVKVRMWMAVGAISAVGAFVDLAIRFGWFRT